MSCFLANRSRPSVFEFPFLFSNGYALFHFPYPVSPVFATLTKTAGCVPTIPILELIPPITTIIAVLSFLALANCPFCNPFVLMVLNLMGGTPLPSTFDIRTFRLADVSIYFPYLLTSLPRCFVSASDRQRVGRYNGLPIQKELYLMQYRRFGRTGWNVSEIGYGMWGLAGWTGADDAESLDALQRAVDLGCNFFDTAWAYGEGRSEQILGKVLRANLGVEKLDLIQFHTWEDRWLNDERLPRVV